MKPPYIAILMTFLKRHKLRPEYSDFEGYLNKMQTQQLYNHLRDVNYLHAQPIKKNNVQCTVSGTNKWLHQHQYSYKQPKCMPHKIDVVKQAAFIEYYVQLKVSLNESEPLLCIDSVHPTQATKVTAGWIRNTRIS
jgi:hypothetical protein